MQRLGLCCFSAREALPGARRLPLREGAGRRQTRNPESAPRAPKAPKTKASAALNKAPETLKTLKS